MERLIRLTPAAIFALLASCNASIGGDLNRGELLHSLALSSARALSERDARAELAEAIRRPDAREGAIRLSEIVSGRLLGGGTVEQLRARLAADGQDFAGLVSAFPQDVDIYIPVRAQREAFTADKEVIVAVVDDERMLNEDDLSDLEAYDAEGNRIFLSASRIPDVTVVVVAPSEHSGEAFGGAEGIVDAAAFAAPAPAPAKTERIQVAASTAQEACNGRAHEDGDAHILQDFMVRDAHEPWFSGDPEIELLMAFPQGQQARFGLNGGAIDVNEENRVYPVGLPLYRWDRRIFAQDILYRIVERDPGFSTDIKVKATVPLPYGVGFADVEFVTTVSNADDDLGIQFVRFEDPCGALYSTGDADFNLFFSPE
jgi:hypothetical protein